MAEAREGGSKEDWEAGEAGEAVKGKKEVELKVSGSLPPQDTVPLLVPLLDRFAEEVPRVDALADTCPTSDHPGTPLTGLSGT